MHLKKVIGVAAIGSLMALTAGCGSDKPGVECEDDNLPVCGKVKTGIACVTEPCENYEYISFESSCDAKEQEALMSFRDYCEVLGLENQLTLHYKPVKLFNLDADSSEPADLPRSEGVSVIEAEITDDVLTVTLGYSGCSEQVIDLNIDGSVLLPSFPVQVNYAFSKQVDDTSCDAAFESVYQYDLLPVRKAFPGNVESSNGLAILGINGPIYKR